LCYHSISDLTLGINLVTRLIHNAKYSRPPTLPLVRLKLVLPFIEELDRSQVDVDSVLEARHLTRSSVLDSNHFVSADTMYRLLEDAASAANDPYLGVRVGEALDFTTWSPLVDAAQRATSLSDFLTRFILAASADVTSARFTLEVGGTFTVFRQRRSSEPNVTPSQNDAFTAAYVLSILQCAVGAEWDPQELLLRVCTPGALPADYQGIQIVEGDNCGMSVRFPTHWLSRALDQSGFEQPTKADIRSTAPAETFVNALRQMLEPHLGRSDLTVDRVAQLCGLNRQTLQRRLNASGTNLAREISGLKEKRAVDYLEHSDQSISAIAKSLGFDNPASFSRTFKAWTGHSPRKYRETKSH
jgi:AraC-like DNA-binding protein